MTTVSRAHSFNAAAADYAAHRPPYPPALLDALEEAAGRPLAGARVLDVGAGTGIATGLLAGRGARAVGVEPGAGMAAQLHRQRPELPVVRGDGNALPFADGTADLITYAQSWHWTEPERAGAEVLRVLRPGGTLALWWNVSDETVPWVADQAERITRHIGPQAGAHGAHERYTHAAGLELVHRAVRWSRRVSLDHHLANLASHSYFLVLGEERTHAFLATERAALLDVFPDGEVPEAYYVDLLTARTPTA
ncbi:class I SAM-dependent methyltransferase [Streptomyces sp. NPDC050560]|uniref:class I SAM-dependent methyltransferase n=1 Tax=Streptomyces sp. NPDC050560 TaxID=3365630 RepID=UPI0037A96F96